jgi:predicted CXXCH cytochrome family protein
MGRQVRRVTRWGAAVVFAAAVSVAQAGAGWAQPSESPHAPLAGNGPNYAQDTDLCALCHWTHAATGEGMALERQDEVMLCYTCHGSDGQGSTYTVQNDFKKTSVHSLWPSASAFGPNPKACSSCHDVHGDKDAAGQLYPKLLRARDVPDTLYGFGSVYYGGDAFCGACHAASWTPPGQSVDTTLYESTVHYTKLADPPSGTRIRCEACHAPHGSNVAPLLAELTNGVTVTADDKRQCFACHAEALRSYDGSSTYDGSTHGRATSIVSGKPSSACQNCHDPHGRRDAAGIFPNLTAALEGSVCYRCHGPAGPAAADLQSAEPTSGQAASVEVVAAVSPSDHAGGQPRLAVLSQDTSAAAPRPLRGPYEVPATGSIRALAVGDVDGDGSAETLLAVASSIDVVRESPLSGLFPAGGFSVAAPVDDIALGDVNSDGSPEIVTVSAASGSLVIYRASGGTLVQNASYATGGAGPRAVALGDVDGDGRVDVIVANTSSDSIAYLRQNALGSLDAPLSFSTDSSPTDVAIADLNGDGRTEVVVANSGSDTVRTYTYAGGTLSDGGSYDTSSPPGAHPRAVLAADLLAAYPGAEIAVSLDGDASESVVDVFRSGAGGSLAPVQQLSTGLGARTWDLGSADVNGDGARELVAANAGTFLERAPSISVFGAVDPSTLGLRAEPALGAAQDGGTRTRLALGDVGALYPYRHATQARSRAHRSSEEAIAPADRHVECVDCHNVHVEDRAAASAPIVVGPMRGTSGMRPINGAAGSIPQMTAVASAADEFEACFKCHSGAASQTGARDVAIAFNPANPSFHPVEAVGAGQGIEAGAWTGSWTSASRVYCGDCHGSSGSGWPAGPHFSRAPSILRGPYAGAASDSGMVCYRCHRRDAYWGGDESTASPASRFYDGRYAVPQLHSLHLRDKHLDCRACHVAHGSSTQPHLIRDDIGYTHDGAGGPNGGGSCSAAGCHGATRYYRAVYP